VYQLKNYFVVIVKGVIFNNGKLLIVQRGYSEKVAGGTWECPGGKVEWGEDLETALKREMKEETGLMVEVNKILYVSTFNTDQIKQFITLTYLCKTGDTVVTLSKEHMDFRWVTKGQSRIFLAANIISDFEKNNIFSLDQWQ
jgi:8-oxo-dGTP diphosphatase